MTGVQTCALPIFGICDRAYIINDGSVLAYGKPDEIVYNDSVRKVYLGEHFRL